MVEEEKTKEVLGVVLGWETPREGNEERDLT
jgi:hypothetical protein